mmetsp:Transcript_13161/g.22295  ORF Transcript_13161/g.22295 Transcript_13161/m.22295 type:complete len:123 (+) Transcript_13161:1357-1725(+)
MVLMDDEEICDKIYQSQLMKRILEDFEKYKNNTNILLLLNSVVKSIISLQSNHHLPMNEKILFELKLVDFFARQINQPDYQQSLARRLSVYPFIHNFTSFLIDFTAQPENNAIKERLESETE